MSITFNTTLGGPELNMANGNAVDLLKLLELPVEPWGEVPAEDFLGRILLAQGLLDVDSDGGRPDVTDGRFTSCGHEPGYLSGRLADLYEVALWAHERGAEVCWG